MKKLLAVVAVGALAIQAGAASITWDTPYAITGDSDVATTGVLHIAESPDHAATVNGVTFDVLGTSPYMTYSGAAHFYNNAPVPGGLSSDYTSLLKGMSWDDSGNGYTYTIGALKPGEPYMIQVWSVWTDSSDQDVYDDGNGNQLNLTLNGTAMGIGYFTADATTQTLTETVIGSSNPIFNAIQVRQVPEAASIGMIGVGAGLLLAARRFMRM